MNDTFPPTVCILITLMAYTWKIRTVTSVHYHIKLERLESAREGVITLECV